MRSRLNFILNSATGFKAAVLFGVLLSLGVGALRADVCVWRDPERTMQKLFPAARDYKTRAEKMTPERIAAIEQALGERLEDTERKEFDLYDITGNADGEVTTLGTVLALAEKGEYGTIEVVVGVDRAGGLVGVYVQRTRERAAKALQAPQFLLQFAGKTKNDGFEIGKDIKPASPDALAASRVVAFVVKKMLVFHDVLSGGKIKI